MKNVAVFTYCEWNSYGSILQAYGLKRALGELGFSETIHKTFKMESPLHKRVKKNPKSVARYLTSLVYLRKLNRVYKNNTALIKENFNIVYYDGFDDLKNTIPEQAYYLCGSDQVWNPDAMQKEMFLDFDTHGKPRLSYAASFGMQQMNEENSRYIKDSLESFRAVSVREKSMVQIIKSLGCGVAPVVHLDPVFLVSAEEWRRFSAKKKGVPAGYILVYALYWNPDYNDELMRLSRSTRLPVISIQLSKRNVYCDKKLFDCDLREFLWMISNAEYVVTSSFHGLAFSILFNKKFSAVINPDAPARLTDLMDFLGVGNCAIADLPSGFDVDYNLVNQKIENEQSRSMDYLRSVLYE